MSQGTFVYRRGDSYSFRCWVPERLSGQVPIRHLVRGLRTRDARTARFLSAAIGCRIEDLWSELGGLDMSGEGSENEIRRLIRRWFDRQLDLAWKQFNAGSDVRLVVADIDDAGERRAQSRHLMGELADQRLERMSADFRAKDYREAYPVVRAILSDLDAPVLEDDRRFTIIAREVMKGEGHLADAQVRWAEGDEAYTPEWSPELPPALFPEPAAVVMPEAPTPAPAPFLSPAEAGPKASGVTLSEAFKRYTGASHMKAGTVADFGVAIRRFTELHGDLDLHHITKRHILELRDALLRLPRSAKRGSLPELVKKAERDAAAGQDVPRLSPKTINEKSLAAIRATLNYAMDNDLVRENVAARVAVKMVRNAAPARAMYDRDDLRTIFNLPIYATGDRPAASGGEASVWLPILALYTGARLNELATLTVGDVRERDGVRFLFIRDGKTRNARRKVPIHGEIVRLGFLDYLATRGTRPDEWVFPAFKNGLEEPTRFWSAWWGRYARAAIPDTRKVFHSFRHTAKHALRNAGVDKTLRDAAMGHDHDDVAERYGLDEDGEGYALPVLAVAIEKISYPGLEIVMAGRTVR